MHRQHYRARDKTVRKMGRDGLMEENLRSGESVRVSKRETDHLTLPKTADDSMNFQDRRSHRTEDKKTGGKQRSGYSPDFKRPASEGTDNIQADYYQTDAGKADSYRETDNYGENVQGTFPDRENIPETDTGGREGCLRQVPASSSYRSSGGRKKYIPEPLAARYRGNGTNVQQEKSSDMEPGTVPDMASVPGDVADTMENVQGHSSHEENIREKAIRGEKTSSTDAAPDRDGSHNRKKKQVYAYSRRKEEQRERQEGKENTARREDIRHTANQLAAGQALQISQKDSEKKTGRGRLYQEQKKKDSRLHFDKEGGMVRGRGMEAAGRAALKAGVLAASALADGGAEEQQEDMETEVLLSTKQAGERTLRYAMRQSSRRMQKRSRWAGEGIPEADRERKLRKFYQKRRIKKAYAEAKRGEKTAEGAAKAANGFWGKAGSIAAEIFRNKKGLLIAAVFMLLIFLFFSAGLSSCSAMVQGASSTFIGTTYPSEDEDIYDAEKDYKELEEALDEQINTMEAAHPGYDEYRYQVDEITHNPYQLVSFLTVLYEEFTYNQVKDILPELFAERYRLTVEEITETRTRTETRTVTDPLTGAETEEEVEVEYEWHVLCICLTNKGFDTVARGRLTQEQAELYSAYNLTYGNRSYLFDVAGLPSDNAGGAGYEIPEEALSDEQFARMIREAEKYLGRAYVWGGASPETGFDCSGFVSWVINNSGNGWDVGRQTAEGLRGSCAAVSPSEAKPGDLVFFQGTYNTSGASHVGIYAGNGMMIHAGNPVKYSNIRTPYWEGHLLSYGRIQ